jgi:tRNA-dihydrouridine synthase B
MQGTASGHVGLSDGLRVGPLALDRRVFMAPMAGITTPAFRRSVRRWGAGLVFTEMISSHGICYGNRRTLDFLACREDEHPIGFQLFGSDPAMMAPAAELCVAAGADLVDINMACPVRKVMKTGAGAALLERPAEAAAIVAAVAGAVGAHVPVTVKIRTGLRQGDEAGRRAAPRLVAARAAAICIHPRSAAQQYRGAADHGVTRDLAAELPVPVIASGDIVAREECEALLADGVAAVMAARAAVGRPWLFAELLGRVAPDHSVRLKELRLFVEDVMVEMGARAVGHLRQFWPRFRRSGTITGVLARQLMEARSSGEVAALLGLNEAFCIRPAKPL